MNDKHTYRLHKATGQAFVQIKGRRRYLGKHGTAASREKYNRLLAEYYATQAEPPPAPTVARGPVTIAELTAAFYWEHVRLRYVKRGKPTSEQASYRTALRPVIDLYGSAPANSFGPLAMVACRSELVDRGLCRKRINGHVTRIRKMFQWGVSRELVPETVWRALLAVEGLREGEARETAKVRPVDEQHIAAIEPFVTPQIWAMVQFQLWTGCRPGEVCGMRTADLDTSGDVWRFRPQSHKTEHHGIEAVRWVGPRAQAIISPWLRTNVTEPLFQPREGRRWYFEQRRAARQSKVTPSQAKRRPKRSPLRTPGLMYTTVTYGRAIERACARAGVPAWNSNQLRHNAATRIRAAHNLEASRAVLGHQSAVTTEIYAERDEVLARSVMLSLG